MVDAIPGPQPDVINKVKTFFKWAYLACGTATNLSGQAQKKKYFQACVGFSAPELSSWISAQARRGDRDALAPQITSTAKLLAALNYNGEHRSYETKGKKIPVRKNWEAFSGEHAKQRSKWEEYTKDLTTSLELYFNELKTIERSRVELALINPAQIFVQASPEVRSEQSAGEIKELSLKDFTIRADFDDRAIEFLQGRSPTLDTAIHAAVPRSIADDIVRLATRFDILIVHGAIGEGTSTVLMQSALQALKDGRRVFRVIHADSLLTGCEMLPWTDRPFVFLDNAHQLTELPRWLHYADSDQQFGSLILGTQTRRRSHLSGLLAGCSRSRREIRIPAVRPEHADTYVELIERYRAAPKELSRERIGELFRSGLSLRHGLAGLWPAQYQATRGMLLDQRLHELVGSVAPHVRQVLSMLAFAGFVTNTLKSPPPTSFMILKTMLDTLEPDMDKAFFNRCVEALLELPTILDGELKSEYSSEDARHHKNFALEFRHPALTESIFRWCFGAADLARGEFNFAKWPLYSAFACALPEGSNSADWTAYSILRAMQKDVDWDYNARGELRRRLTDENNPRIGDHILSAISAVKAIYGARMADGGGLSRRLNILEARALTHEGRVRSLDDLTRAKDRIDAALANAFDEDDYTVLRQAASLAQEINYVKQYQIRGETTQVDWKTLIVVAEILEERDSKTRPTKAARDFLNLLLKEQDSKHLNDLLSVINRSEFLTSDHVWGKHRLSRLRSILNWVRRREPYGPTYLIPKCGLNPTSITSIQSIYCAFWRELNRLEKTDSTFRNNATFHKSPETLVGNIIKCTFEEWLEDFEKDSGSWPDGAINAVASAHGDFRQWLTFMRSLDDFPELHAVAIGAEKKK